MPACQSEAAGRNALPNLVGHTFLCIIITGTGFNPRVQTQPGARQEIGQHSDTFNRFQSTRPDAVGSATTIASTMFEGLRCFNPRVPTQSGARQQ